MVSLLGIACHGSGIGVRVWCVPMTRWVHLMFSLAQIILGTNFPMSILQLNREINTNVTIKLEDFHVKCPSCRGYESAGGKYCPSGRAEPGQNIVSLILYLPNLAKSHPKTSKFVLYLRLHFLCRHNRHLVLNIQL